MTAVDGRRILAAPVTRNQRIGVVLAAVFLAPAVVWLALAQNAPAGKSGGTSAATLGLAVVEERGTVASEIAESYARRVESLSRGSIQVTTSYWPARFEPGTPARQIERAAVRAARTDEVELAIVPAHTLDGAGAISLRALHAPFLVSSAALAARVTTGPIAAAAQAGLGELGLVGLGLVPEGLYRPFGYLKPLVAPADFEGVTIRAPASRPMRDVLRSLGARSVDIDEAGTSTAVHSGFVVSPESFRRANDAFPQDAYTTAAVALFPKIDVIVASPAAVKRLTARQRAVLRRAAADLRREQVAASERQAALAFCAAGGTIVAAPHGALRVLRRHTAPLRAALQRDATTKALIAAVQRLDVRESTSAPTCDPAAAADSFMRGDNLHPNVRAKLYVPVGSYRRAFSSAELRAAGADDTEAETNSGLVTLTFYATGFDTSFVLEWPRSERRPPCRGRNDLVARRVRLVWNPATPCSGFVAFAWKLDGADLVITALDPRSDRGWTAALVGTWMRVDCKPVGRIYDGRWFAAEEERLKALPNGFCN